MKEKNKDSACEYVWGCLPFYGILYNLKYIYESVEMCKKKGFILLFCLKWWKARIVPHKMFLKVWVESVYESLLFWRESKYWLEKAFCLGRSLHKLVKLSTICECRFGRNQTTHVCSNILNCLNSAAVYFPACLTHCVLTMTDGTKVGGRRLYDLNAPTHV